MIRYILGFGVLVLAGCSTIEKGAYRPQLPSEKKVFSKADRQVTPSDVRTDFKAYAGKQIAWAGIVKQVEFKDASKSVKVAFLIEHRDFDWMDHGGDQPYLLSTTGLGTFAAGWEVDKPTSIKHLKKQVKAGDMIIVYGTPYQMKRGVIQIVASSVRPIPQEQYGVVMRDPEPPADAPE